MSEGPEIRRRGHSCPRVATGGETGPATWSGRHPTRRLFLTALLALALPACRDARGPATAVPVTLDGWAMGTSWKVMAVAPDADSDALQREIAELLENLESLFSHYREDSEVSRFNQAEAQLTVPVSTETARLVTFGEQMRRDTAGAFDIRVARTVARRGFGPEALATPDRAPHEPAGSLTVTVDPPALRKDDSSLAIDLSAFAKGHAVDRVAGLLEARGIHHYLVEIGGELKARGTKSAGQPWSVGIEVPRPGGRTLHLGVTLANQAIATSGNYRLFDKAGNGRIQSHLVDPRNPADPPATLFRSVSVLLPDAMSADAWATALFVLGETDGAALAREREIPACFLQLTDDGQVKETLVAGFAQCTFR